MMKIAISSTGNTPDSILDRRFGRCSFFAIYDMQSKNIEYVANPGREAEEGAGPVAVQLIAGEGVQKVVSGEFGVKVKPLLDKLQIQMIAMKDEGKTIADIIRFINH